MEGLLLSPSLITFIFIFAPGLITYALFEMVTSYIKKDNLSVIIYGFIFSVFDYLLAHLLIFIKDFREIKSINLQYFIIPDPKCIYDGLFNFFLYALLSSAIIGLLIAPYIYNRILIPRILKNIHVSDKRHFYSDILHYLINKRDIAINARIIDSSNNTICTGRLIKYNPENKKFNEISMKDCKIEYMKGNHHIKDKVPEILLRYDKNKELLVEFFVKDTIAYYKAMVQSIRINIKDIEAEILDISGNNEILNTKKITINNIDKFYPIFDVYSQLMIGKIESKTFNIKDLKKAVKWQVKFNSRRIKHLSRERKLRVKMLNEKLTILRYLLITEK